MKITLRASGTQAPENMKCGEYIARCKHGEIKVRGSQVSAVLQFTVVGRFAQTEFVEEHAGVVLRQWFSLGKIEGGEDDIILDVQPHSKYSTAWSKAMGRPLKSTDDPDPKAFEKKIFRVDVGFRSNSGGTFSYKNLARKKDAKDFLRIHEIIEKIEEKALTHMPPYAPIASINMLHEHEHGTKASTLTSTNGIRMNPTSHMNNEPGDTGHRADMEPGQSTQDSPRSPTPEILPMTGTRQQSENEGCRDIGEGPIGEASFSRG